MTFSMQLNAIDSPAIFPTPDAGSSHTDLSSGILRVEAGQKSFRFQAWAEFFVANINTSRIIDLTAKY